MTPRPARALGVLVLLSGVGLACKTKKAPEAIEPANKAAGTADPKLKSEIEASMKAFENRKRYPKLTVEILKRIPDAELEQALIDFVDCEVQQSGQPERDVIRKLSPGFRAVYATWILEGEVNNGGFNQFFWNSSGDYAEDARAGFDLLGAKDHARLMRRAIAIRDADQARTRAFKDRGTIEAFSESYQNNRLNALDDEFARLGDDLSETRIKFVRRRPEMFVGSCRVIP